MGFGMISDDTEHEVLAFLFSVNTFLAFEQIKIRGSINSIDARILEGARRRVERQMNNLLGKFFPKTEATK